MSSTPLKRTAEQFSKDERPAKRISTSSPEEGELDDSEPQSPRSINPPSSKSSISKVVFPFKTKHNMQEPSQAQCSRSNRQEDRAPGVIYNRPDDRHFTEEEQFRKFHPSYGQYRRRNQQTDHWEPGSAWPGDRDGRPPGWDSHRIGHERHIPLRNRYGERGYDSRDRSPRSARSDRSLSPSSTPQRGKHRLPSHRSPTMTFSPPARHYDLDWLYDQRMREEWNRPRYDDSGYFPDGRSDERHYRRDHGPHRDPSQDRTRDSFGRFFDRPHENDDGHLSRVGDYRPGYQGRAVERPTQDDHYRPLSPRPHPTPPDAHVLPTNEPPPQPPSSPPPIPPAHLTKDDTLPTSHAAISIAIPSRRLRAPRDDHSPSPFPLPPTHEEDVRRAQERRDAAAADPVSKCFLAPQRRRREPVQRTRKEEMEVYGRMFEGCGQQSDYDATTKLGEGTFGEVHKAIQIVTGHAVALKRILMHNEKEGMPVTALREIKILKAMRHPCIVEILDMFVVRSKGRDCPLSVYMVFPYMDHDLAGLLENERVKLQPSHIKLYMRQLLEGTEYMHRNHVLHRDMKAANLLIDNCGSLRIADFGLARAYDPTIIHGARDHHGKEKRYTNCVVTRWYRPPELLLGARQYGGEVDMWGIGCVLGEMFMRRPILPGTSDIDQLEKIWQLCGTPNQHTWPNFDALPGCEGVKRFPNCSKRLRTAFESIGTETCDLLDKLLTCNPRERITASAALDHDYFWTDPLPADPKTLPTYESSHEFDKRGRRNQPPPGVIPPDNFRPHPPSGHPPFHGRAPPPRESFHAGPPPPPVHLAAMMLGGAPPLKRMPVYPPPPLGYGGYHGYHGPPPPRPSGPPPRIPLPVNPNLPQKPPAPLGANPSQFTGRYERGSRRGYGGGSGGGRRPPPSGSGSTELPYS